MHICIKSVLLTIITYALHTYIYIGCPKIRFIEEIKCSELGYNANEGCE
jgi:hypothetical protein